MLNKTVAESINNQMNNELYSAHLYLSMASAAQEKGLKGAANWFMVQYREEMVHVMKFYTYLVDQGINITFTASQQVPNSYTSLLEMMEKTLIHENFITSCINELSEQAVQLKDHATQIFLQWFVTEQIEEENNDRDLIAKLKLVGDNGYGILMIDAEMATRVFVQPVGAPLAV